MKAGVIQIPNQNGVSRGDVPALNCVFGLNMLNF